MPIPLKQSTASQEVPLGHFVDSADAVTAETGLSIANTDIKVWKNGATTLANKNSGGATHISGGIYYTVLDATDTDTVGPLVLFVAVSGALAVRLECDVLPANVYDARYGADKLQVHADEITAGLITAAAIADGAIDAATFAAGAINAAAIADGAIDRATFAADTGLQTIRSNTAQAGGASTITLDASASAVTDFYAGQLCLLTGGTGVGQVRQITAYNGTTKVATVGSAWATNPDNTSTFALLPEVAMATLISALLGTTNTTETAASSVGGQLRRTHALVGGTKATQDASAANAPIVARNEADSGNLVTITATEAGTVTTHTPS